MLKEANELIDEDAEESAAGRAPLLDTNVLVDGLGGELTIRGDESVLHVRVVALEGQQQPALDANLAQLASEEVVHYSIVCLAIVALAEGSLPLHLRGKTGSSR